MRVVRDRPSRAAASLWFCVALFAMIIAGTLGDMSFSRHRYISMGDSAHGRKLKDDVGDAYSELKEQVHETLDDILAGASSSRESFSSSSSLAAEINEEVEKIIDDELEDAARESSGSSSDGLSESPSSSSSLAAELNEDAQETVDDRLAKLIDWPISEDGSSGSSDSQGGSSDSSGSLGESSSSTTSGASSDSVNLDAADLNEEIKDHTDELLEDRIPSSYGNLAADKNADAQGHVKKTAISAAKGAPRASDLTPSVTERLGSLQDWGSNLQENLSNMQAKLGNLECAQHANKLRNALDDSVNGLNDTNTVSFVMAFKGIDVVRDLDTSVPMEQFRALYTRAVRDSAIDLISKAEYAGCCPSPSVTAIDISPRSYPMPPHLGAGGFGVAVDTRVLYGRSDEDPLKRPLLIACAQSLKRVMAESAEPLVWEDWIQKWTIAAVESLG